MVEPNGDAMRCIPFSMGYESGPAAQKRTDSNGGNMDQATNLGILSLIIVLFLGISMAVARWQERRYGRKDDSPEE